MIEILKVIIVDGVEQLVTELVEQEPVEFRLYYDENGKVLFYTCEKPEGNYVIIDNTTFAARRYDIRVVDGRITTAVTAVVSKLMPYDTGKPCATEDISIVVSKNHKIATTNWKMITYEL
jgi:hypothetical protein